MTASTSSTDTRTTFAHNAVPAFHMEGASVFAAEQTLTWAATLNWNGKLGQVAEVTLSATTTIAEPTNLVKSCFYHLTLKQDAVGARVVSWNTVFSFVSNTAPTLSGAANSKDCFWFKYDGSKLLEQSRALSLP